LNEKEREMPFVKKSISAPAMIPTGTVATPTPDIAATIKGAQLALGRAKKTHETTTAALVEARAHLAQMERDLGGRILDGEGADTATRDVQAATLAVRQLEQAVAVALARMEAAKNTLRNIEEQARYDHQCRTVEELGKGAIRVDECTASLARAVDEIVLWMNEVRGFGNDRINKKLNDANLSFKIRLLDACGKMPGCRTGAGMFLKPEPWSASLPTPDDVMKVERP
jgi:hypothetical protein